MPIRYSRTPRITVNSLYRTVNTYYAFQCIFDILLSENVIKKIRVYDTQKTRRIEKNNPVADQSPVFRNTRIVHLRK